MNERNMTSNVLQCFVFVCPENMGEGEFPSRSEGAFARLQTIGIKKELLRALLSNSTWHFLSLIKLADFSEKKFKIDGCIEKQIDALKNRYIECTHQWCFAKSFTHRNSAPRRGPPWARVEKSGWRWNLHPTRTISC